MIDYSAESAISLTQATKIIPGRPHISTLWRWSNSSCRGVKLETFNVGARRFTTKEAVARFIAATTAAAQGESIPARTEKQRQRALDHADAVLDHYLGSNRNHRTTPPQTTELRGRQD